MERYNLQLFFSLHKVYHLLLQLKETKAVEKSSTKPPKWDWNGENL